MHLGTKLITLRSFDLVTPRRLREQQGCTAKPVLFPQSFLRKKNFLLCLRRKEGLVDTARALDGLLGDQALPA